MDHKTKEELDKEIAEARSKVEVGGKYTHYKTPTSLYEVIDLGVLEADDNICVIYKSLVVDKPCFVRPLSEWLEEVEWQGKTVPRFKRL
jgi:hypothetical protein